LVLIRKIGMTKNRLILTGIFIEMGVIEIEYEPNKIKYSPKLTKNPMATGLSTVCFENKKCIINTLF
jgi:hypothetical protein